VKAGQEAEPAGGACVTPTASRFNITHCDTLGGSPTLPSKMRSKALRNSVPGLLEEAGWREDRLRPLGNVVADIRPPTSPS